MTFLMFLIFFFILPRGSSQILFPSFHKSYRSSNAQALWGKRAFISFSWACQSGLPLSHSLSPSLTFRLPDCAGANLYAPAYVIFIRTT